MKVHPPGTRSNQRTTNMSLNMTSTLALAPNFTPFARGSLWAFVDPSGYRTEIDPLKTSGLLISVYPCPSVVSNSERPGVAAPPRRGEWCQIRSVRRRFETQCEGRPFSFALDFPAANLSSHLPHAAELVPGALPPQAPLFPFEPSHDSQAEPDHSHQEAQQHPGDEVDANHRRREG